MATIAHLSADGPTLGFSNSVLRGIVERALPCASDPAFVAALEETEWGGSIDLYPFPAEDRRIFADAADALADDVAARSDEFPEDVARTRLIAAEVRKTTVQDGTP